MIFKQNTQLLMGKLSNNNPTVLGNHICVSAVQPWWEISWLVEP